LLTDEIPIRVSSVYFTSGVKITRQFLYVTSRCIMVV